MNTREGGGLAIFGLLFAIVLVLSVLRPAQVVGARLSGLVTGPSGAANGGAQLSSKNGPLILTAQIPLPGIHGRFERFTFDPFEPARVFISALGSSVVKVIDLVEDAEVHRITEIPEPQGMVFAVALNNLFVGSRKGKLYVYDGSDYKLIASRTWTTCTTTPTTSAFTSLVGMGSLTCLSKKIATIMNGLGEFSNRRADCRLCNAPKGWEEGPRSCFSRRCLFPE